MKSYDPNVICWKCRRNAHAHCYSEAGHREVRISGICEECFDNMFKDDEEDEREENY